MIRNKILFVGFKDLFPFQVVARHSLDNETAFECIEVVVDGVDINLTVLTLKVIGNPFCQAALSRGLMTVNGLSTYYLLTFPEKMFHLLVFQLISI